MNRRSFLSSLLGAAVASSIRWLPLPAAPKLVAAPATLNEILKKYYLPAMVEQLNARAVLVRHFDKHRELATTPILVVDLDHQEHLDLHRAALRSDPRA